MTSLLIVCKWIIRLFFSIQSTAAQNQHKHTYVSHVQNTVKAMNIWSSLHKPNEPQNTSSRLDTFGLSIDNIFKYD